MGTQTNKAKLGWVKPRLVCLGDLADVAGSPAPLTQVNPGGNTPTAGKS